NNRKRKEKYEKPYRGICSNSVSSTFRVRRGAAKSQAACGRNDLQHLPRDRARACSGGHGSNFVCRWCFNALCQCHSTEFSGTCASHCSRNRTKSTGSCAISAAPPRARSRKLNRKSTRLQSSHEQTSYL